jgi:hypothetical protein
VIPNWRSQSLYPRFFCWHQVLFGWGERLGVGHTGGGGRRRLFTLRAADRATILRRSILVFNYRKFTHRAPRGFLFALRSGCGYKWFVEHGTAMTDREMVFF